MRSNIDRGLMLVTTLAALAPLCILAMMGFMGAEAAPFLTQQGAQALLGLEWLPTQGRFGIAPLVVATVLLALLAGGLAVLVGTPAAFRLAFFAGRRERFICEGAIALMGGLPSIVVGMAGLAWLTPALGYSLCAAIGTLFVMILPTYTLLTLAALRQEAGLRLATCRALGMTDRQFAYIEALAATRPAMLTAATLAISKGLGEATAVSLVIGNVTSTMLPGLFAPANTLTTVILKDHTAASGPHHAALFALGLVLAGLILAVHAVGRQMASRIARAAP